VKEAINNDEKRQTEAFFGSTGNLPM